MTIQQYTYETGSGTGEHKHEDGTVETLHGDTAFTPESKHVILPKELGSFRVDVIVRQEINCPNNCETQHPMLILDHTPIVGGGQLYVVECPKDGFLWGAL